jgi:hypothetical protein
MPRLSDCNVLRPWIYLQPIGNGFLGLQNQQEVKRQSSVSYKPEWQRSNQFRDQRNQALLRATRHPQPLSLTSLSLPPQPSVPLSFPPHPSVPLSCASLTSLILTLLAVLEPLRALNRRLLRDWARGRWPRAGPEYFHRMRFYR